PKKFYFKHLKEGTLGDPSFKSPSSAQSLKGRRWYQSYKEAKYFSNMSIDCDSLKRDFPQIMRRI
ncbi:hypothetical protein H5410_036946, partial [Solanum commersonii]